MGRIVTRDDGARFHLGGRLPPPAPHGLRLHDYSPNLLAWPATPAATAFAAMPAAQPVLYDILGNDTLGDCTEANSYHLQALRQAAGGIPVFHPTREDVVSTYSRDGGYVPGDASTDQGCDEGTVLSNAQRLGIVNWSGVNRLVGSVCVDPANRDLVRACVSMFVGGAICMGLPDAWVNPFPQKPGWTWDVPAGGWASDPSNGHCFTLTDQSDASLGIMSWGMPATLTYDALAAGATQSGGGALYFLLDYEIVNRASLAAPDALDWEQLKKDFAGIPEAA